MSDFKNASICSKVKVKIECTWYGEGGVVVAAVGSSGAGLRWVVKAVVAGRGACSRMIPLASLERPFECFS